MTLSGFLSPAFVSIAGECLLHFLWQGAALAALLPAANFVLRPSSARTRYALHVITLFLMALAPVLTAWWLWQWSAPEGEAIRLGSRLPLFSLASLPAAQASTGWTPWLVTAWMCGVALLSVWNATAYTVAWAGTRRCRTGLPQPWPRIVERLRMQLHIRRRVQVFCAPSRKAPCVFGNWRPVILVPAAALVRLTRLELEAILAHELAHIARHDWLVNLLQVFIETVLFYHPAVWWVSRGIRREREFCCDDMAAAVTENRRDLARALVTLEESRWSPAVTASGSPLRIRIQRLLDMPTQHPAQSRLAAVALLVLLAGVTVWHPVFAAGQNTEPPPPPPPPAAPPSENTPPPPPAPPPRRTGAQPAVAPAPPQPAKTPLPPGFPSVPPVPPAPPAAPAKVVPGGMVGGVPGGVVGGVPGGIVGGVPGRAAAAVAGSVPGVLAAGETADKSEAEKLVEEEVARRIRWTNQRFSKPGVPGYTTDRGRIYLLWGPPDELEVHPGSKEMWRYRLLPVFGKDATFEFDGEGKLTKAPSRGPAPI